MKKIIVYAMCVAFGAVMFTSCSEDELNKESVITVTTVPETPFDKWLTVNFVNTYNLAFKYRYEDKEADMDFYTVPADYEQAVELAHLVKYLCLETYDEVGGIDFTRSNFPKEIFTIGEFEYQNNGTFVLGTAEGGKKIILMGVNHLDDCIDDPEMLNHYYFKTIHHEFTHILNQTKDYAAEFKEITGTGYVADSWSSDPYSTNYLKRGFISSYAQHSDTEDFAEMLSMYITNSAEQWNEWLEQADGIYDAKIQGQSTGKELILSKLDVVRDYMENSWDIDIDKLRASIQRRQKDIAAGRIDLKDLSI